MAPGCGWLLLSLFLFLCWILCSHSVCMQQEYRRRCHIIFRYVYSCLATLCCASLGHLPNPLLVLVAFKSCSACVERDGIIPSSLLSTLGLPDMMSTKFLDLELIYSITFLQPPLLHPFFPEPPPLPMQTSYVELTLVSRTPSLTSFLSFFPEFSPPPLPEWGGSEVKKFAAAWKVNTMHVGCDEHLPEHNKKPKGRVGALQFAWSKRLVLTIPFF